jgi:hypothetical protein
VTGYVIALWAHSYLRWAVLITACVVIARAWSAQRNGAEWTRAHERWHAALVGLVDLQFTIGLLLYLVWSPFAAAFMQAPGATIKEHTIRFFGLEHPTMMAIAVALLHIGRVRAKKATLARDKHLITLRWTLGALLIVLSSIPWPGLRHGRPLLRADASDHWQGSGDSLISIGGSGGGATWSSNTNSPSLSLLSRSLVASTSSP